MASANVERPPVMPREIVRVVAPPPLVQGHSARLKDKEMDSSEWTRLLPISSVCDSDVMETRGISVNTGEHRGNEAKMQSNAMKRNAMK